MGDDMRIETLDEQEDLITIIEAILMAAEEPLSLRQLHGLFSESPAPPTRGEIQQALTLLQHLYRNRGVELVEVASGWRMQVPARFSPWLNRLYGKPQERYSQPLFETLALIAYEQPITRSEIEAVRGVSVNTNIIRTLEGRGWIEVIGRKEVPGRPMLYGTTAHFLNDFNLRSLEDLPPLPDEFLQQEVPFPLGAEEERDNRDE